MGYYLFHERSLVEPYPAYQEVKMERGLFFPGYVRTLRDKNNPYISEQNEGLFLFPQGSYLMDPSTPYMEAGVGIENIFKFLRLDYVWRLTYKDHPGIQTKGIRFMMKLTF